MAYFTFQGTISRDHFRETCSPIGRHVIGYWKRPISKFHYRFRATRIPQYLTTSIQDVTLVSDGFTSLFVFYSYISDSTRGRPRILETLHGKQRRVLPVLSPIPNFIYIYIFRRYKFTLVQMDENPRFSSDSEYPNFILRTIFEFLNKYCNWLIRIYYRIRIIFKLRNIDQIYLLTNGIKRDIINYIQQ